MSNLLKETKETIDGSGHKPSDIIFIGSRTSGHSCTWEEFEKLADFEYDSGFGSQKIASDLEIIFSDGQSMRRGEYDGSEWWEFSKPFTMPQQLKEVHIIGGENQMWATLEEMNRPGGKYRKAA